MMLVHCVYVSAVDKTQREAEREKESQIRVNTSAEIVDIYTPHSLKLNTSISELITQSTTCLLSTLHVAYNYCCCCYRCKYTQ